MAEKQKPRFILCNCTGECPGFAKLEVWPFINLIRTTMDVGYAIVHPQLCVEDGDRFWRDLVKPDITYIVGACDPRMQKKMFKDIFVENGGDFDKQVISLDLRNMTTAEAINKVKEALDNFKKG